MFLPRTTPVALLLSLLTACLPAERSLAPSDEQEHGHDHRHNLTTEEAIVYRWSDPEAWIDGVVPPPGANVTIPADRHVMLDRNVSVRQLLVNGTLEFSDSSDLELVTRSVTVQGAFRIGAPEQRHRHRAVITLVGTAADGAHFGAGAKGLIVTSGSLELHGQEVRSWTQLVEHARAGSAELVLREPTDWRSGDRLAISATGYNPAESEDVVVAEVAGNRVRLRQPLRHSHWGVLQTIAGRQLDERAQVALLSRNVVIQGDADSEASGFGAHVMVHPGATAHIEGAEFHRVGQRGVVGRYPLHWHLAGDASGQYARNNAVWHSYSRCMTIHGTHRVTLEANVCYDHEGHGFFLEDGIERGNVLVRNLGMRTRAPEAAQRLLPSDAQPATFWVSNPDNDLHDNVAAGSDGFGIWYSLPEYPTGLSATRSVRPRQVPLRRFENNEAHSNVLGGLWVDEGVDASGRLDIAWYEPTERGLPGAPAPALFRGLVAWKNQALGAWLRGSHLRLVDAVLADNMSGASFAASESTLEHAFVVGVSDNVGVNPGAWSPVRGFWFYDGTVGVSESVFANFDARAGLNASALGFHPVNPWPISADNWLHAVRFVDAIPVVFEPVNDAFDATKSAVLIDRDGSLGDAPNAVLVPDSPLLREGCQRRSSWNAFTCTAPFTQLVVRADAPLPMGITVQRVGRPESLTRIAPVRYDPTFATVTVPQGARLDVTTPGLVPHQLTLAATLSDVGTVLDVTLPQWRGPLIVEQRGRAVEQRKLSDLHDCVSCWGFDPLTGALRLRLLPESGHASIHVTVSGAG